MLAADPSIQVFFSPNGGCQDAIVREIAAAKKSIRVQAYSFTNAENLLILKGFPDLVKAYQENYEEHRGHSV